VAFIIKTGLRYRMYGRERLLTLGAYPEVTLRRAREKRDEARKLIADAILLPACVQPHA
jgi:Arm DNA-binding domain